MEQSHTYIAGQSGTGKSTLLKNDIINRIYDGHGLLYLDPHGHDTDDLLDRIPKHRRKDVLLFDPTTFPLAWNPLAGIPEDQQPFIASTFVDTIKAAWGYANMSTPTMDMFLYFSMSAIMQVGGTIVDIIPLLTDSKYRQTVRDKQTDPIIKDFWERFDSKDYSGKERRQETASTLNKLYVLCGDPRIRQVIGQKRSSFSMADVLENNRIFFTRLPQGRLGLGKASLIGSLLLSQAHITALSRQSTVPFHFYLDEGHLFASSIITEMLSGIRKFGCRVIFSHQYIDQVDRQLFTALMGNCPVRYVFRVSREDAQVFQKELPPNTHHADLDELANFTYRTFPFHNTDQDATVAPLDHPTFGKSRVDIETNMRRNYMRGRG